MLATTTITWALIIAGFGPTGQMQAVTNVAGFGSPEACEIALEVAKGNFPANAQTSLLCLPVDHAKPLPNALKGLHDFVNP